MAAVGEPAAGSVEKCVESCLFGVSWGFLGVPGSAGSVPGVFLGALVGQDVLRKGRWFWCLSM